MTQGKFYIALFLSALVFALPIMGISGWNADYIRATEKRTPAPFPTLERFTTGAVRRFFQGADAFLGDHVAARRQALDLVSRIFYAVGTTPSSDKVTVGRDGWFFYTDDQQDIKEKITGKTVMPSEEIESKTRAYAAVAGQADKNGIPFVLFVSPDKSTIYPEYLPAFLAPAAILHSQPLVSSLLHHNVPVFDAKETLLSHKGERLLYFRSDSHWNSLGAFIAFRGLLSAFDENGTKIASPFSAITFSPGPPYAGDLLALGNLFMVEPRMGDNFLTEGLPEQVLDKYCEGSLETVSLSAGLDTPEPHRPFTVVNPNAANQIRVWLFRDSFSAALCPFIHSTFAETTHFFNVDGLEQLDGLLDAAGEARPNLIIYQVVERNL